MTKVNTLSDIELLKKWQQKALVCICKDTVSLSTRGRNGSPYLCVGSSGDWCGPQRISEILIREIKRRKIELPVGLYMGISEDNSCGRRKLSAGPCEFDLIMNKHIKDVYGE